MRAGRFFIEALVLFAVLTVIAYGIEVKYRSFKTPADHLFDRYAQLNNKPFNVIIGNSHMGELHRYYPDQVTPVLNLSIGGQDLFREYVVLRKIIRKSGGNVKTVLMGLDYDVMGYNQVLSGQGYIDKQYFIHVDTLYKNSPGNRLLSSSAFFRANRDITFLYDRKNSTTETQKDAFIPLQSTGKLNEINCKARAREHSLLKFNAALIKENAVLLGRIIELCNSNNTRLIIITTPKSDCYRSYADKNNSESGKSEMLNIIGKYKTPYFDLYSDPDFKQDDYVDYDHLNDAGIKKVYAKINHAF